MLATRRALSAGLAALAISVGLVMGSLALARLLPLRGGLLYSLPSGQRVLLDLDRGQASRLHGGDEVWVLARDGRRVAYSTNLRTAELLVPLRDGTAKIWPSVELHSLAWDVDNSRVLVSWQPVPASGMPPGLYWLSADDGSAALLRASERRYYGLSIAPNGRQAVSYHAQDVTTGYDLFLIDLASGAERPLLATAADETWPSWSADGQWIAYQCNQSGSSDICLVSADGQQVRNLTRHPALDSSPSWSPDGRWIAFSSNREGNFQVYLLDMQSEALERVSSEPIDALYPRWLP